jgi:hypothetical protein
MPESTLESTTEPREEIPWAPVTEQEIERVLKAKRETPPGRRRAPYHRLEEYLEIRLTASINLGYTGGDGKWQQLAY